MSEPGTVPGRTGYREISARAIALGIIQGIAMTAAFTYAGLKLGFGVGGSSVAAIMGLVILRGAFRDGSACSDSERAIRDGVVIFLGTPYCIGTVVAIIMNLILPKDMEIVRADPPAEAGKA